jgi:hypothetical protein
VSVTYCYDMLLVRKVFRQRQKQQQLQLTVINPCKVEPLDLHEIEIGE